MHSPYFHHYARQKPWNMKNYLLSLVLFGGYVSKWINLAHVPSYKFISNLSNKYKHYPWKYCIFCISPWNQDEIFTVSPFTCYVERAFLWLGTVVFFDRNFLLHADKAISQNVYPDGLTSFFLPSPETWTWVLHLELE